MNVDLSGGERHVLKMTLPEVKSSCSEDEKVVLSWTWCGIGIDEKAGQIMEHEEARCGRTYNERHAEGDRSLLLDSASTVDRALAYERRVAEELVVRDGEVFDVGDCHRPAKGAAEAVVAYGAAGRDLQLGGTGAEPDPRAHTDADPVGQARQRRASASDARADGTKPGRT